MASGRGKTSCTPATEINSAWRFQRMTLTQDELAAMRLHAKVNGLRELSRATWEAMMRARSEGEEGDSSGGGDATATAVGVGRGT